MEVTKQRQGGCEIHFTFGTRDVQDPSGYLRDSHPFIFTVNSNNIPETWGSAYAVLGCFVDRFINVCMEEGVSSKLFTLLNGQLLIPTSYLDRPTIEIRNLDGSFEELLIDDQRPNPELSQYEPERIAP